MKTLALCVIAAFSLSVLGGLAVIPLLKKIRAGQPILEYVETHKDKNGTPTMGGLFFIVAAAIIFFIFGGGKFINALVALSIGLAFMLVGFIDDFLKIKYRKNEGLKPYQKIIFQTAIACVAGFFVYKQGITQVFLPFTTLRLNLGFLIIPLAAIIFIAITNSVNLTDGLDGLAGSSCAVYLIAISILITVQAPFCREAFAEEAQGLVLLSVCLVGAICGFLVFNVNKAKVFMGDSGSLSLGGFIGAISIFSANSLFIPIMGITFVASSVSVIIQVVYFKRTKKRVFLMAPLHHHFQMKGYSKSKIAYIYSLITCITGLISIISYL